MAKLTVKHKFAKFLFEKRNALGLTQRQLADILWNDTKRAAHLCRIENGKGITIETMDFILEKLNSTIEFIEN